MKIKEYPSMKLCAALAIASVFCCSRVFAQSAPASCTASIGYPANGAAHYIDITWSSVAGATSYQLQDSTPGSGWAGIYTGTAITYAHNTGSTGNLPFFYRVNATNGGASAWTNSTQFPIYNACNDTTPVLSNATSSSISALLQTSGADSNANNPMYAIYCVTTNQYVQANGSLGSNVLFQTAGAWGTVLITGLSASRDYCFYTAAQNNDGNVQIATGPSIVAVQNFNTSSALDVSSGSGTKWYSPNTCSGSSEMSWHSGDGCNGSDGAVGYTTSPGEYYGCFLRSPVFSASGQNQLTLTFDLTNTQSTLGDSIYFSIWSNGSNTYYPPSFPAPYSIVSSINGQNVRSLYLNTANNCTQETVTIDLSQIPLADRSSIYLYFNTIFYEEAGTPFNLLFDNIGIGTGYTTACLSTTTCSTATITSNPSNQTVCSGNNASFTVESTGGIASYQWQISLNGNTWNNLDNDATYSNVTAQTLDITDITSGMSGNEFRCALTGSCPGSPISTAAILTVDSVPATPGNIIGSDSICPNSSSLLYYVAPVANANSYVWTIPADWTSQAGNSADSIFATAADSGGIISVAAQNNCGTSAAQTLAVTVVPLPQVTLAALNVQLCNDTTFTVLNNGSPGGGVYSGPGVSNDTFYFGGLGVGSYILNYTYANAYGCSSSDTATATVQICTGIENVNAQSIEIYPNPFSDNINLKFNVVNDKTRVIIIDETGRTIIRKEVPPLTTSFDLNTSALAGGVYLLQLIDENGESLAVRKVLKLE
jgi:hypothetical protein